MPDLNEGEISLTLGDDTYTLRPTLNAIRTLSRAHGGLRPALQTLFNQDFDGVVSIIKIGAGVPDRDEKALAAKVYAAGMNDATLMPLVEYLKVLMNGGKPPPPDDAPPTEETEGNA